MPAARIRFWPLSIALVIALAGCSDSQTDHGPEAAKAPEAPEYPVTWRFALEEIEGSVQHAYAEALKERIEERSEGKIEVDIFPTAPSAPRRSSPNSSRTVRSVLPSPLPGTWPTPSRKWAFSLCTMFCRTTLR